MVHALLVGIHLIVGVILILVVLLQTGKAADLAGAFGGGGSQTAFGSRGAATFLSKATTGAAIVFMITSFLLSMLSARGTSSILERAPLPAAGAAPSGPGGPAPATPSPAGSDAGSPAPPPAANGSEPPAADK